MHNYAEVVSLKIQNQEDFLDKKLAMGKSSCDFAGLFNC